MRRGPKSRPHISRLIVVALGAVLGATIWMRDARANGRMPGATELAIDATDAKHIFTRTTFGLVQSFDGGVTWKWICEQAIRVSGEFDPPTALMSDGSMVLLPPTEGALISRDKGCTWSMAQGPLEGKKAVDLTLDPRDPMHLVVLSSSVAHIDDVGVVTFSNFLAETHDNALSWSKLSDLPADLAAETVEIAPSDANRIYVSGTTTDVTIGIVERSEDGGKTWSRTTVPRPSTAGSVFISAIDPRNPDRLWVRLPARGDTFGRFPASLSVSHDKGATWVSLADTQRGMFGFALSPDGSELAYGGPFDGLFVGLSDGSGGFRKVNDVPIRCLRWLSSGLYVCGSERPGPFSVGVSQDHGATFDPLYNMANTCPEACSDGEQFATTCGDAWSVIAPAIMASGATCRVPWTHVDGGREDGNSNEGGVDAAEGDAATPLPTPSGAGSSGCSCELRPRRERGHAVMWASVLACLLAAGRSRKLASAVTRRHDRRHRTGAILLGGLAYAGCGGDPPPTGPNDAGRSMEDSPAASDGSLPLECPQSGATLANSDTYVAGLEKTGSRGVFDVRLIEADPPPPARGLNRWTIRVTQTAGGPVGDARFDWTQSPWMPCHQHGTTVVPEAIATDAEGTYLVEPIYFTMPGIWKTTFNILSTEGANDNIAFNFYIAR
jgi:hypothetical protein